MIWSDKILHRDHIPNQVSNFEYCLEFLTDKIFLQIFSSFICWSFFPSNDFFLAYLSEY